MSTAGNDKTKQYVFKCGGFACSRGDDHTKSFINPIKKIPLLDTFSTRVKSSDVFKDSDYNSRVTQLCLFCCKLWEKNTKKKILTFGTSFIKMSV